MSTTRYCPVCLGEANLANFGGCCDACEAKRQRRLFRDAAAVRARGHEHTPLGRALRHVGS